MASKRSTGTGTIQKTADGSFVARVRWRDAAGRRRGIRRSFATYTAAKDALDEFNRERARVGPDVLDIAGATFAELSDLYERTYCGEPVYRNGRKTSGLRSRKDVLLRLRVLREHFGGRKVSSITHAGIVSFKRERLAAPTKHGRPRSIATVNRELAILRRVLRVAVAERWIARSPFEGTSETLISVADEQRRERVLSPSEEARLLDACTGRCAGLLLPLVVVAIDTGARRGELLALRWRDVDLAARRVRVVAENAKTQRARSVPLTTRAVAALESLSPGASPEAFVFARSGKPMRSPRNAWVGACRNAGLVDLHFHDLRATCGTRLCGAGVSIAEVARVLGHANVATTFRHYVRETEDALDRAAAALDRFHAEANTPSGEHVN